MRPPQRMQRQRAAFVHAVVEHVARSRVGQQQILRRIRPAAGGSDAPTRRRCARRSARTTAIRRSRRSPRAARCARQRLAVTELPNHWWASSWAISRSALPLAVAMVGAEDRNTLCLKRYLQVVVGHHHGVAGRQRVRPEQLDEQLHHLRLVGRSRDRSCAATGPAARRASGHRSWPCGDGSYTPICSVTR